MIYFTTNSDILQKCAGQDLNLQALAGTTTSRWRVCQFRHPRLNCRDFFGCFFFFYRLNCRRYRFREFHLFHLGFFADSASQIV